MAEQLYTLQVKSGSAVDGGTYVDGIDVEWEIDSKDISKYTISDEENVTSGGGLACLTLTTSGAGDTFPSVIARASSNDYDMGGSAYVQATLTPPGNGVAATGIIYLGEYIGGSSGSDNISVKIGTCKKGAIKLGRSPIETPNLINDVIVSPGTRVYVKVTPETGYIFSSCSVTSGSFVSQSGQVYDGYVDTTGCTSNITVSAICKPDPSNVRWFDGDDGYRTIKGGEPGDDILVYDTITVPEGYTADIVVEVSTETTNDGVFIATTELAGWSGSMESNSSKFYTSTAYASKTGSKTIENIAPGTYYAGYRVL